MKSTSNDDILILVPSTSHTDITVYEQLEQLQIEIGKLRSDNETLKISGRDLLIHAPRLIDIPPRSNVFQETLEDIIQKQANEIQRLHDELEREKCRCLIAIDELELIWEEQVQQFLKRSFELQEMYLLSSRYNL